MQSLAGKRCIVSGGSRGIGLAIAQLFAAHGAACTLIGRDKDTLSAAVASLSQQDSLKPHGVAAFDVANPNDWHKLMSEMKSVSNQSILT